MPSQAWYLTGAVMLPSLLFAMRMTMLPFLASETDT
jgi:hypothetical protein